MRFTCWIESSLALLCSVNVINAMEINWHEVSCNFIGNLGRSSAEWYSFLSANTFIQLWVLSFLSEYHEEIVFINFYDNFIYMYFLMVLTVLVWTATYVQNHVCTKWVLFISRVKCSVRAIRKTKFDRSVGWEGHRTTEPFVSLRDFTTMSVFYLEWTWDYLYLLTFWTMSLTSWT